MFRLPQRLCLTILLLLPTLCGAQEVSAAAARSRIALQQPASAARRARAFSQSHGAAGSMNNARAEHLGLVHAQSTSLSTAWTPVGPVRVQSQSYGLVTGRVTALALDPNDATNNTLCTVTPQYNDLSATGTVTVTLLTGTTAKAIRAGLLLPLLLLPLCARRSSRRSAILLLLLCCVTFGVQGCGSDKVTALTGTGTGGSGGGVTTPVTPIGSYTITVSATAAGVTHAVPLTLKVQ